jgi:hypothetical protein
MLNISWLVSWWHVWNITWQVFKHVLAAMPKQPKNILMKWLAVETHWPTCSCLLANEVQNLFFSKIPTGRVLDAQAGVRWRNMNIRTRGKCMTRYTRPYMRMPCSVLEFILQSGWAAFLTRLESLSGRNEAWSEQTITLTLCISFISEDEGRGIRRCYSLEACCLFYRA